MEARTIAAAVDGEADALAAIVDEFMPTVLGAAYGLTGDWHDAGDVAQEVFATMVVRLSDLREPAALPGWLMAITRNVSSGGTRLEPQAPARPSGSRLPRMSWSHVTTLAASGSRSRRCRPINGCRPSCTTSPGMSLADIAELCDLPLSTVKKRMRVARARLREGMDDMPDMTRQDLNPTAASDPSDVIRMYTAMRSGDIERVETDPRRPTGAGRRS